MSAEADDGEGPLGRVKTSTKGLSILPAKLPSPPDAEFSGSVGASFLPYEQPCVRNKEQYPHMEERSPEETDKEERNFKSPLN